MNTNRIRALNDHKPDFTGPIIYWMSRDQRAHDNWALLYAQHLSHKYNQPCAVVFSLTEKFPHANRRHFDFMLRGLAELSDTLHAKNIPFILLHGDPTETIPQFIRQHHISTLITDFSPLKIGKHWREHIANHIHIPMYEVDTHNIVPTWIASPKQEFGAYTLRPKLNKLLSTYLDEFPPLKKQEVSELQKLHTSSDSILQTLQKLDTDETVQPVDWIQPGEKAAHHLLKKFIEHKLRNYGSERNDPTKDMQSDLSPYLHYGHISSQRIAIELQPYLSTPGKFIDKEKNEVRSESPKSAESFLEELIVRKELSDNFCYYNQNYDSFIGFPNWAQQTLNEHRQDPREFLYTLDQLENAQTYDDLWNASQKQLVQTGKIHGYMRMYWAKKILEWTESPEQALEFAIYLNDKYHLDGRDPNGYTGIAWSIGGVHDRVWFDRPVIGKIRYMSAGGAKTKFNVQAYIKKYL